MTWHTRSKRRIQARLRLELAGKSTTNLPPPATNRRPTIWKLVKYSIQLIRDSQNASVVGKAPSRRYEPACPPISAHRNTTRLPADSAQTLNPSTLAQLYTHTS